MKKTSRYLLPVILALTALTAATLPSCNTTGCTDNQNSLPLAGIYSYTTGNAISISGIAIGGSGAPNDSLLASPGSTVSQVYLPFRATEPFTTFYITYHQEGLEGQQDQVTFYYDTHPWFASEECGAMYHYRITRVAHTYVLLDSVGVSDSLITNIERETLQLFFRTAPQPTPGETPEKPGDDPENPDDNPDNPDDNPSDDPSDNPGDNPDDNPDDNTTDNPEEGDENV